MFMNLVSQYLSNSVNKNRSVNGRFWNSLFLTYNRPVFNAGSTLSVRRFWNEYSLVRLDDNLSLPVNRLGLAGSLRQRGLIPKRW